MIIDGKAVAEKLKGAIRVEVRRRESPPTLCTIMIGENPVSEQFLSIKKKFAAEVGIPVRDVRFPSSAAEEKIIAKLAELSKEKQIGVIVQLPLPPSFDAERILNAVSPAQDVDVLSNDSVRQFEAGTLSALPTVIAAFDAILTEQRIMLSSKKALVIGRGKLVGAPAAVWLRRAGAVATVADSTTSDLMALTKDADIIILGAGAPWILTPDMIKEGVIILDAGTSEQGGKVVGDVDPACAEKASLYTPTPGGICPITVAMVFKNLLTLTR